MLRVIGSALSIFLVTLALSVPWAGSQDGFDGKSIFRFDTFGDEQLWTDTLQMQKVVANISPATALSVGLKVDSDALPPAVIAALKAGQVNLNDPAVTVQLNVRFSRKQREVGDRGESEWRRSNLPATSTYLVSSMPFRHVDGVVASVPRADVPLVQNLTRNFDNWRRHVG